MDDAIWFVLIIGAVSILVYFAYKNDRWKRRGRVIIVTLNTGEEMYVATNNDVIAERMRVIRETGLWIGSTMYPKYTIKSIQAVPDKE